MSVTLRSSSQAAFLALNSHHNTSTRFISHTCTTAINKAATSSLSSFKNYGQFYPRTTTCATSTTFLRAFSSSPYKLYPPAAPFNKNTDIISLEAGQRIVSIGDVHGDGPQLVNFLKAGKLVDDDLNWVGGSSLLVQLGDILDRGDQELACTRLLCKLSKQAAEAGGGVILLYGNHEALNSIGLFQYAFPGGNAEFERDIGSPIDQQLNNNRWRLQYANNQPARWAAYEPGGLLSEDLMASMKVSVVVGRSVFVHAGLTAEHIKDYGGIEGMNKAARDWILTPHGCTNNEGNFATVEEVIAAAEKRAQVMSNLMPECLGGGIGSPSPVWMRDYSQPANSTPKNTSAQKMIDAALASIGSDVQRMVMGHTPQRGINAALKGKAWRIDVGASRGVANGTPEVLEIIHGGERPDIVNILTMSGQRIPSSERQVFDVSII